MMNFNSAPYFDNFDPSKNFNRILFKPGYAVQGRELTQSQTILQDQISKFAANIFTQNTPVTGGQVTTNFNCSYLKLNTTYSNTAIVAADFLNQTIQDSTGTVFAKVIATTEATGTASSAGDPPTLIISYNSGTIFTDNTTVYAVGTNFAATTIASNSQGYSSVASIAEGVFYVVNGYSVSSIQNSDGTHSKYSIGNFVSVLPQTIILDKYDNTPTFRVGLEITEDIIDYIDDSSLLDPAVGATNYQAPGADRYRVTLTLTSLPITLGNDDGFIELLRVVNGTITSKVNGTSYSQLDDYLAKRTVETNGDYVVNQFSITPKPNAADSSGNTYTLNVGPGVAYVNGYRVENQSVLQMTTNRARNTANVSNNPVYMDYGSFFYVDTANGLFDVTQSPQVDFHCVPTANINTANATTYNSTLAGTGYIRNLDFDHSSSLSNTSTYVYRAYVYNVQNTNLTSNASSATSNTLTIYNTNGAFSSSNVAYVGATLTISSGTDTGDSRLITAYNGITKTITVNQNFTVTPDTTSQFTIVMGNQNIETMVQPTAGTPYVINAHANVNSENQDITSNTVLQNANSPELIFPIGQPYVSSIAAATYTTKQTFRNVNFVASGNGSSAVLTFGAGLTTTLNFLGTGNLSVGTINQNYIMIVTNSGANANIAAGQILSFSNTSVRSVNVSTDHSTTTITCGDLTPFTATIIATVDVINGEDASNVLKAKNLVLANTADNVMNGTIVNTYTHVNLATSKVYIQKAGLVNGTAQSLYVVDVKNIVSIINVSTGQNITGLYTFDNGQRDSYYGFASIKLAPGATSPNSDIIVYFNYYSQSGGNGYFSVQSYLSPISTSPEAYATLPTYTSSTSGTIYQLRDCLDFRPALVNAQSSFTFRYTSNPATTNAGLYLPEDLSIFSSYYAYFLARNDILALSKDKNFFIVQGTDSVNPQFPQLPRGALAISQISLQPYTAFLPGESAIGISNANFQPVNHQRWAMSDITNLQTRVNNLEYYTSLSTLEQNAQSLQVSDQNGLNRFKNGILVDDFSSFNTADTQNSDYFANINRRTKIMTAAQNVSNFPLQSLVMLDTIGQVNTTSLGYGFFQNGATNLYSLPYQEVPIVTQQLASRTTNLNPFSVSLSTGVCNLTPPTDNWVDNTVQPEVLITDPNIQVYNANTNINVLNVGDWQTIPGTTVSSTVSSSTTTPGWAGVENATNPTTFTSTTTTTTTSYQQQQNTLTGNWSSVGQTYNQQNGYITDISILPYIRPQQVIIQASGMLVNTPVNEYFDNINVNNYFRKTNKLELTGVSGSFSQGDVIGYMNGGTFVPTAYVADVYVYPSTPSNVKLYLISDNNVPAYSNGTTVQNVFYNTSVNSSGTVKTYGGFTASGTIISSAHRAASITKVVNSTTITLSTLAQNSDPNTYVGNTIYFVAGTSVGSSANIVAYYPGNNNVLLNSSITASVGDIYSIGQTKTNEAGSLSGVFYIPTGKFYTGQRVFRIDNSVANNITSATTVSTATYTATGLSTTSQATEYAPSISSATNTFSSTQQRATSSVSSSTTTVTNPPSTSSSTGGFVVGPSTGTVPVASGTTVNNVSTGTNNSSGDALYTDAAGNTTTAPQSYIYSDGSVGDVSTISPGWEATFLAMDPVAQTFMVSGASYPNGAFVKSIKLFFASKPTNTSIPVTVSIVNTTAGVPNGPTLDYSVVSLTPDQIQVSQTPQYLDPTSYTLFEFNAPVYLQPNNLYAFIVHSNCTDYTIWLAAQGDNALSSSVKNLPTDPTPSSIAKISTAPYIGSLFVSQNSLTWTADQGSSLMMVINACQFNISQKPTIAFTVPSLLPERKMIDQVIDYQANTSNLLTVFANTTTFTNSSNVYVDAINVTTTDFIPSTGTIAYSYNATLSSGGYAGNQTILPGHLASTSYDNVYLNDGKGERVMNPNTNTSFLLFASMLSNDFWTSPLLSDDGLSVFTIQNEINNLGLSNASFLIANTGSGYTGVNTAISISAPTSPYGGTQAYATPIVANGAITGVYVTNPGSGYCQTPTITLYDTSGNNAVVLVSGETSTHGGNAITRYVTKKVVLSQGNDSGDMRVFFTAYRPVGTSIYVYYKIISSSDTQLFDQGSWQMMTIINGDSQYSTTRNQTFEFEAAPGTGNVASEQISYISTNGQTYTNYIQFAVKIVLATSDKTNVPYLSDIRALALPSGTGL